MDPKRIAQYARMMRKEGIKSLTIGDVAILLDPDHTPKARGSATQPEATSTILDPISEDALDEESLLFWSSVGPT